MVRSRVCVRVAAASVLLTLSLYPSSPVECSVTADMATYEVCEHQIERTDNDRSDRGSPSVEFDSDVRASDLQGDYGGTGPVVCGGKSVSLIASRLGQPSVAFTKHMWNVYTDGSGDAPTIQAAIDSCVAGDTVLVHEGTYTGDGNRDIDFLGKAIVVSSLSLRGETIIDCEADSLNPHRGFTFESGEDSTSILVGIVVRNAFPPLDTFETGIGTFVGRFGGAVLCDSGASPHIKDCKFERCGADAGAALLAWMAPHLKIERCTILSNVGIGGAAVNLAYTDVVLVDCVFDSNTTLAEDAGALEYHFCTGSQTGCTYRFNTSGLAAGALKVADSSTIDFFGCTFIGNEALVGGSGGALKVSYSSVCRFTDCAFTENSALQKGGAIYCAVGCSTTVSNCAFVGNWAEQTGSAIALESVPGNSLHLNHCGFALNVCNGEVGIPGSVVYLGWESVAAIRNCSFAWNTGPWLSELSGVVAAQDYSKSVDIDNTVIAWNYEYAALWYNVEPTLQCCDLFGNDYGDWTGMIADQLGQNGNIAEDPRFCESTSSDLDVRFSSPCAPDNNDCAELIGSGSVGCTWICGDADAGGFVNISDAVYLIAYIFGGGPAPDPFATGDVDCSEVVNISDVVYLIAYIFGGGPVPCADCQ